MKEDILEMQNKNKAFQKHKKSTYSEQNINPVGSQSMNVN